MKNLCKKHSAELRDVLGNLDVFHDQVEQVVQQLKEAFAGGNKVLIAGNGGSAAEAQHFSDEMVGRYKEERPSYPVVALTADSAVITCIGNDYGYENIFKRQVEGLGKEGDVFIGLTTSGTSRNILAAAEQAREMGMTVVAFTGNQGTFKDMADYAVVAPTKAGARMQELHLHAIHLICEAFEPAQ
ncbi:MAG: SIS domain-containing protein [bacterium]